MICGKRGLSTKDRSATKRLPQAFQARSDEMLAERGQRGIEIWI